MVDAPSIDALRTALAPMEALRGEQSQFESLVLDSFGALESMHGELAEWQRELALQQAELEERAAALSATAAPYGDGERATGDLEQALAQLQEDYRQLEAENADQLQALDEVDRQLVAAEAELRAVRKHVEDLSISLDIERERGVDEHRHWVGEMRETRRLLEHHSQMLAILTGTPAPECLGDAEPLPSVRKSSPPADADQANELASRASELRRRANSRLATQRRSP